MKRKIITHLSLAIVLLLNSYVVFAGQREIIFPINDGQIEAHPSSIGFNKSGQIGVVLAFSVKNRSKQLFSFSVAKAEVIDSFNLTPDFGIESGSTIHPIFLKLHSESGVVLVYGLDTSENQKVVALALDSTGKLAKRWAVSYPTAEGIWPEVTFNDTGSNIYIVYSKSDSVIGSPLILLSTKITVLRAEDGVEIGAISKPEGGQALSIIFDSAQKRAVATIDGTAYILTPEDEEVKVESTIETTAPTGPLARIVGISKDGRFLIAYAGYSRDANSTSNLVTNIYISYDLNRKEARTLFITEKFYPGGNLLTFHQPTSTLFAPLYFSRLLDVISLNNDGSLFHTTDLELPKRSADNSSLNTIKENNIAVSATGTLGFLALNNGRLFSFDTLTGEIVGDDPIEANSFHFIHLLEPPGLLVYRSGLTKLVFVDISTGPVITNVKIKKKTTTLSGMNFLSGLKVKINGVEAENVERSLDNPGRQIIINQGRKNFPEGQDIVLTVENRDGVTSKPFTLKP